MTAGRRERLSPLPPRSLPAAPAVVAAATVVAAALSVAGATVVPKAPAVVAGGEVASGPAVMVRGSLSPAKERTGPNDVATGGGGVPGDWAPGDWAPGRLPGTGGDWVPGRSWAVPGGWVRGTGCDPGRRQPRPVKSTSATTVRWRHLLSWPGARTCWWGPPPSGWARRGRVLPG